jgi:hypothetical protein
MQTITTIGLDIAKSVFQVHGVDAAGQVVIRRQCMWTKFSRAPSRPIYQWSSRPSLNFSSISRLQKLLVLKCQRPWSPAPTR